MRSEVTSLLNESVTIAGSITDLVHMQDYSTNKYKVVSGTPVQKVPPQILVAPYFHSFCLYAVCSGFRCVLWHSHWQAQRCSDG